MTSLIRQRADGDCGIAALASLACMAYEDVYHVVAKVDRYAQGKLGLNNKDIIIAARLLGLTLEPTRSYDPDVDSGVLRVRWSGTRGRKNRGGHFVALKNGLIFCPTDAIAYDVTDYLAMYGGRACTLLRAA